MSGTFDRAFLGICIAILAAYAYTIHTYFFELDLVIAWQGFSVIDFANSVLYPENFVLDFPGGAAFIGNSLLPWIYPFVAQHFGIAPLTTLYVMIGVEVLLLIGGAAIIMRTFFAQPSSYAIVCLAILFLASTARKVDLALFGSPFLFGQFYVFADMLRLAALCALLSRRYFLMAGVMMAGFTVHLSVTALALPVLLGMFSVNTPDLKRLKPWLAATAFCLFAAAWFLWFVTPQSLASTHIPEDDYFVFSRLFNFHWYLSDMRLVFVNPDAVLLPFMGLVLAGLAALHRTPELGELHRKQIVTALAIIYAVSLIALVAVENEWSITLQKIAPQRLSAFAAVLVLPIIVHRMFMDLRQGAYGYALLGAAVLATTVFQHAPYSIALVGLYALPIITTWLKRPVVKTFSFAVVLAALPPLLLLILHWSAGFSRPIASYIGLSDVFGVAVLGLIIVCLQTLNPELLPRPSPLFAQIVSAAFVLALMLQSYQWMAKSYTLQDSQRTKSKDYKDVQLWAKANTEPTALFMTDPCISYGWRDFSQRSSWGSIQEFLKTGWLYSGNLETFEEGLRRAKQINVDPLVLLRDTPGTNRLNHSTVCDKARSVFYQQDPVWIADMVDAYGVDYLVMEKVHATEQPRVPPIYENSSFFVLSAAQAAKL